MKVLKMITVLVVSMGIFAFTTKINPEKTIADMVMENQDLSTLSAALEAADLVEVLKAEGPYTVFAPNNRAFDNLPEGKLSDLLKPENKAELAKVLKYHVVDGKIYASDLDGNKMIKTLEGKQIRITASSAPMEMGEEGEQQMKKVKVNNAKVLSSDITASNGVIHIIDGVVSPSDIEAMGTNY